MQTSSWKRKAVYTMKETTRRGITLAGLGTSVLLAIPVVAQGHPETWKDPWLWVSADYLADSPAGSEVPAKLIRNVGLQARSFERHFGSAKAMGLAEGQVVGDDLCPPLDEVRIVQWGYSDASGYLDLTLVLSEVAVLATVRDVILGFATSATPVAMLVLENQVALYKDSPLPAYALVPLGQAVIMDRVFCGDVGRGATGSYQPETGQRIVLVGSWRESSTVPLGFTATGAVAVVNERGEMRWRFVHDGPNTQEGFEKLVAETVESNLREMALQYRLQRDHSEERSRFGYDIAMQRASGGCARLRATKGGGEWELTASCEEKPAH